MSEPSGTATAPDSGQPSDSYLSRWTAAEQGQWPLRQDALTIGRSAGAEVSISWDLEVSRLHARLERVGDGWTIIDDGLSRNGTFVNGRRLSGRIHLHDRDEIRVGNTRLTFCAPAQPEGQHTLVNDPLPRRTQLTNAQRAVLVALCRPYKAGDSYVTPATNQQIAGELFLSVDAVKTHLRALFHKLGIDDLPQNQKRARLADMALQLGLVSRHEL